jgi:hypothetical protein
MATTTFTSADLAERTIRRRAVEAAIWGMPIVNFDLMYQAMARINGTFNQIVYWSRLSDWKNQTLTPNPDSIYLMPFIDTKEVGPVCLRFRRLTMGQLWDPSWIVGSPLLRTSDQLALTKARVAST